MSSWRASVRWSRQSAARSFQAIRTSGLHNQTTEDERL
uniref:Uncharacterized protein n=1 Tax=Pseudomonas aeruginosa TaxID=287 RepID=A0A7S5YH33_PSEAI|nr:hypothetical protein [Pseudomonas aeruginosa]UGK55629.1 Hypothetical protein [Pseudomonas aeruginosa]